MLLPPMQQESECFTLPVPKGSWLADLISLPGVLVHTKPPIKQSCIEICEVEGIYDCLIYTSTTLTMDAALASLSALSFLVHIMVKHMTTGKIIGRRKMGKKIEKTMVNLAP
uniref:Uncharacterized protein n=1 Tax=Arion vulgaris TaxID=1028688 RepID=A0A0B7BP37_9EUPU